MAGSIPQQSTNHPTNPEVSVDFPDEASAPQAGSAIKLLLRAVRPHRRALSWSIVLVLIWTAALVVVPILQKLVVDDSVIGHKLPLVPMVLALLGVGAVRWAGGAGWRYLGAKVSFLVQQDMRTDVYRRLQRLDARGHAEVRSGEVVARLNTDVQLVQQLTSWAPLVVHGVVYVGACLAVMLVLSPLMSAVVAAVMAVVVLVVRRTGRKLHASGWDSQQREADMTSAVEEAVTGIRVVRSFGQESAETGRVRHLIAVLFGARVRAVRLRAPFLAWLQTVPLAGQAAVLLVGGWLAMHGQLSLGTLLSFFSYLASLSGTSRMIGMILTGAPQAFAATTRVGDLLRLRPTVTEPDPDLTPDGYRSRTRGELAFRKVVFAHPDGGRDRPVLDGFDLTIRPGERVALVGRSGAGKSTALNLAPRVWDVDEGSITLDGADIRELPLHELRRRIAVVSEDRFLFSDSVAANIAWGRPEATREEIEEVAKAAAAHEFIMELPDGYDTVIGEQGLTLSGGQRQRLTLARALLVDADVLLLDDATSAIDEHVERIIHENLEPQLAGRSVLLIAYRESTLRTADRIVVVDEGRVVAEGAHEDLLRTSPLYAHLFGDSDEGFEGFGSSDDAARGPGVLHMARSGEYRREEDSWPEPDPTALGQRPPAVRQPSPEIAAVLGTLPAVAEQRDPAVEEELDRENLSQGAFRMGEFLRPYMGAIAIGMLFVVLDAIGTIVGPKLIEVGVDSGVRTHHAGVLLAVSAAALAVTVFLWWDMQQETLWTNRTAERALAALRMRIFVHLQRLGVDYFDRTKAGWVMSRITSDVSTVAQLLQAGLVNALVGGVTFAGMTVMVVLLDARLALVLAAVVVPVAGATLWYQRKAHRNYKLLRERISLMTAALHEGVNGVRTSQLFRREERNTAEFDEKCADVRLAAQRAQVANTLYGGFIEFLAVAAIALGVLAGAWLMRRGTLEAGALLAFLLYLAQAFAPVQQLAQVFDVYQQARAGLVRIRSLLGQVSSTPQPERPRMVGEIEGDVRLEQVRLRYHGAETDALRTVDLHVPAGQRVAFVGRTGAGKSTIAKLVTRFYDPTEGRVLVDGQPLTALDVRGYRSRLGYVPQEPMLFSRSVRDNIAYGRPDASDEEVEAAAVAVGAHGFIRELPGGYRHILGTGGGSLSAGQRQLLCLARALLVDPGILVLDEATSNLDLAGERRVNRAMRAVSAGRTTLVVTHRPQALAWVDRVVRVHQGEVVEDKVKERAA
ncbi:hypothetical protein BIV57_03000 [Mangrovactinospora gilvigrisea]|uniref:ABC transporter n=1 Tax=Mangrovactinospora gilvigrisea TaxID=1428644 RepID=A0A1J7CH30_9ACTN|nr:ABC transporter ATP-binding protein [Mangrovactinospora gilvigrisea]OIV38946.1 hypothetical protein BIV57_03000 [Mangrovactinospora gilvigrisea]